MFVIPSPSAVLASAEQIRNEKIDALCRRVLLRIEQQIALDSDCFVYDFDRIDEALVQAVSRRFREAGWITEASALRLCLYAPPEGV